MKIAVKTLKNRKVKELDLPEQVFAYPYREHLIHTAVQAYLAGQRAGTHNTKTRAEVRGSGAKPYRQKGTGRSRAGSARSPLRRAGGVAHGPRPRSYAKRLSVGEKKNALKSALARKVEQEQLVVLDKFELESHKTGELAARLEKLGVTGKALLVDDHGNSNLALASRNNPRLKAVDALAVNIYDVVDRERLVLSEEALGKLVEVLSK